ncbi:MAG: hypothetical protein JWN38_900 [Candidatus Saccharibacteria bacterium]|nr:hypothetical protein [Candidatus Saccharibacteria bacterium]
MTTTNRLEFGIVTFYCSKLQSGIVSVLGANNIQLPEHLFFDFKDGSFITPGLEVPEFSIPYGQISTGQLLQLQAPGIGTKLVFFRGDAERREVASWGHAQDYEAALATIASRPAYRIVRRRISCSDQVAVEFWTGSNIYALSATYPKDRRLPFEQVWSYTFEERMSDSSWQPCADPRVYSCCIPPDVYHQYNTSRLPQGNCSHQRLAS